MTDTLYIANVEGAILRDDRYLLIVRGDGEKHAAGVLALVGGKIEGRTDRMHAAEETLRREIREEVGVEVSDPVYLHSNIFTTGDSSPPCLDLVFLCRYVSGEPVIQDAGEVAAIQWLTVAEVHDHPAAPPWLHTQIRHAEAMRQQLGW